MGSKSSNEYRYLIIHGPNLNLLGEREPDIYGTLTEDRIAQTICDVSQRDVDLYQSNHEGDLIDALHEATREYDGVIINPGALTHYSYAIYDAIRAIDVPVVEAHLSDINGREAFRATSVTAPACRAQYFGEGIESYKKAMSFLQDLVEREVD